jgi:multidrug efflux pump subunit AcrA (membrane-fusion protein)
MSLIMAPVRKPITLGLAIALAGSVLLLAWGCSRGNSRGATAADSAPAHADLPHADPPGAAHEETGGAGASTISLSPEARANIGLAVAFAEERVVERMLQLNATLRVEPDREAFVSSRVQGKVTAVHANVGSVVRGGESLVEIQSLQIAETPPVVAVTSPLDGVVLERTVTVGETVDPTKSLMHVADLSRVFAEAEVYEADLARVRIGQPARLRVAPYPERIFTGRVVRESDAIDPARRTLRIWIEVQNTPDRRLKPEMFAQVSLVVGSSGRAVTVPNEAVQSDGPERFVFVQNGDGYLRQPVIVGEHDDRYTAITSGVVAGDVIVTRGAAELKTVSLQPSASGVQDESKPHAH